MSATVDISVVHIGACNTMATAKFPLVLVCTYIDADLRASTHFVSHPHDEDAYGATWIS